MKITSIQDAEMHAQSRIDTPDLQTLLSTTNVKEQVYYLLKYPNWYILYGNERKTQLMMKKLVTRRSVSNPGLVLT